MGIYYYLIGAYIGTVLLKRLISLLLDPAREIPGPFWCRISRLWILKTLLLGRPQKQITHLHQKYGRIVRIAPKTYSIADLDIANELYGIRTTYEKSDFYASFTAPGDVTILTNRSNANFQQMKRKYASGYSMSTVVRYEHHINECIALLLDRIAGMEGQECNVIESTELFLTDTMAAVTFGENLGALKHGEDMLGISRMTTLSDLYGAIVGLYPGLHRWLWKLIPSGESEKGARNFVSSQVTRGKAKFDPTTSPEPDCFVDAWLLRAHADKEKITSKDMRTGAGANMDGTHTTGHAINIIMFLLFKHPQVLQRLRIDLEAVLRENRIQSDGRIPYNVLQGVPYLHAVMKEALRLFPVIGFLMPRLVPEKGMVYGGFSLPKGSIVGIHLSTACRDKATFGENANDFCPERWLSVNEDSKQNALLNMMFSIGPRSCIGKHLATMIMAKLLAELCLRFDFSILSPQANELDLYGPFVPKANEFTCKIMKRNYGG